MEINIFHFFIRAFRKCLRINQLLKTERCRSTFRLNFLASCWLLVSPCAMRSPPTYRRGDLAVLTSIYTHQACNKASWLKSRVAIVSILVGLSITVVDMRTAYVIQCGVWPYVTHAFRQSADSTGLCPIQLAWSRHRFVVLCCGAYALQVG